MKHKTTLLFFFFTFSSMIVMSQEKAQENTGHVTATISIMGMACQEGCADKIADNLKNIEGVEEVSVSYETKEAIISFNDNTIAIDQLKNVITSTKVKEYVYTIKEVTLKKSSK